MARKKNLKTAANKDDMPDFSHMKRGAPRRKAPHTTKDGRLLGKPVIEDVPENLRNLLPEENTIKHKSRCRKEAHRIREMCRTLHPLSMEPDGEITLGDAQIQIRGLNQHKLNLFIASLRRGNSFTGACRRAGIAQSTMSDCLSRGERGIYPYTIIAEVMKQISGEIEEEMSNAIREAGFLKEEYIETVVETYKDRNGNDMKRTKTAKKMRFPQWQAASRFLESKYGEEWGVNTQPDGTGNDDILNGEDLLLVMDATTLGLSRRLTREQSGMADDDDVELMDINSRE